MSASTTVQRVPLRDLALLFLRLGSTSFGGPAVHIAMMHREIVERRQWISGEEFLDMLSAANLIPGPNSTELAIHIGYRKAGWLGWMTAGICFIVPAAILVGFCAWGYVRYGALPQTQAFLYGIKPVVIAIVVHALLGLLPKVVRTKVMAAIATASLCLALAGVNELLILLAAAAAVASPLTRSKGRMFAVAVAMPAAAGAAPFSLPCMFLFFLKVGSVLFGSGYVLFAFLRADLVERWRWLTDQQLADAIAIGQITPGPVFTTATFIGYLLAGPIGALAATAGIFLPAFFFVAVSGPLIARIRRRPAAGAALDGVNAASLALMAAVTYHLGRSSLIDPFTCASAAVSLILLFRTNLNPAWMMLFGAAAGWIATA